MSFAGNAASCKVRYNAYLMTLLLLC